MAKTRKINILRKWKIQALYIEGFTVEELAIMYDMPYYTIKNLVQHLTRQERI